MGFGAGVLCSLAWQRLFSTGRVDLTVADPRALAAIAATLTAAAFVACIVPIRRAVRLDPVTAMRGE